MLPKFTFVKLLQKPKENIPTVVIVSGMVISVSPKHPEYASAPIVETELGKLILVTSDRLLNKDVTVLLYIELSKEV